MALQAHIPEISATIQLAVAPVFLLTAVGTILGALNIRLGRAVDRRRQLEERLPRMPEADVASARGELSFIERRIRFVYLAILFAVVSGLFVCLLIASAFLGAFIQVDLSRTIGSMFVVAMLSLIGCLLFLLREVFLAVSAPRHVPK